MHLKLTPVRRDKLTERFSIPALRPGDEVGTHAAIVPQVSAGPTAPCDRPLRPRAGVCMGDGTLTPAPRRHKQKGPDNASVHLQLPLREGLRRRR